MGMPSTAARGAHPITQDTGNAGYEPPWAVSLDQTCFEEFELAHLQQRLQADPALEAAMASAEAMILRVLEGDDYVTRGSSDVIASSRDGAANRPHGNRGAEQATSREIALRLLAAWLAAPAPDDRTEQVHEPVGNGSLEDREGSTRNVGTYSNQMSKGGPEYVPTSDRNGTDGRSTNDLTFLPPPRNSRPEWSCLQMGLQYNETAQPARAVKRSPYACKKCANCIRYQIYAKAVKYSQSLPGLLQTILTFTALDPTAARKFASNRQHSRRLPSARRYSQLSQEALSEDTDGSNLPCDGYLLWDGEMDHHTLQMIEAHAKDCGVYHVNAHVTVVDENKFREWLPSRLSLVGRDGEKVDASHFGRGWAKETKPEKDGRDGRTRVKYVPQDGDPVTQCSQNERAQAISNSWRPDFAFQWDLTLTPQERKVERGRYIHLLHRARYINYADWLYCMSPRTLELTKLCIEMRLKGEKPNFKHWQTFTDAPQEMIDETAKWLMGKREPEPAITLVAQRLGFISMWREPHIDQDSLAELTDTLPPLLSVEGPKDVTRLKSHVNRKNKVSNKHRVSNKHHLGRTCAEIESHTGGRKGSRRSAGSGTSSKDMAPQQRLTI